MSNKGKVLHTDSWGRFCRTFLRTDFIAATCTLPEFPESVRNELRCWEQDTDDYKLIGFTAKSTGNLETTPLDNDKKDIQLAPQMMGYIQQTISRNIAPYYPIGTTFRADIYTNTPETSKYNQEFHVDGPTADRYLFLFYGLGMYLAPTLKSAEEANKLLKNGDISQFEELKSNLMIHFRGKAQDKSTEILVHAGREGPRCVVTIDVELK